MQYLKVLCGLTCLVASTASAAIVGTDLYTLGDAGAGPLGAGTPGLGVSTTLYRAAVGGTVVGSTNTALAYGVLWTPATPNGVSVAPGSTASALRAVAGNQQVGIVGTGTTTNGQPNIHAGMWAGTAASYVDLTPNGVGTNSANGTDGTHQVGQINASSVVYLPHAAMWSGTAASVVDLHPTSGFVNSLAFGVKNGRQVGYGDPTSDGTITHALTWNGSAASVVDLHPSGFTKSYAYGTDGTQSVGYGVTNGGQNHPLLWTSASASSAVDLMPSANEYKQGFVFDADGGLQVGKTRMANSETHAVFWSGSAASMIDLNAYLPFESRQAVAYSIEGNKIYGVAADALNGGWHAVVWTVPEPASLSLIGLAGVALKRRRR